MHFNKVSFYLADESVTQLVGRVFAEVCHALQGFEQGWVIYLEGDLGAGKSCLSRAFIQAFLPNQKVKSPTYTLVESYQTPFGVVQHFDLYRLCEPEELEFLALRDLLEKPFLALAEWPSKGVGVLPVADLRVQISRFESAEMVGRKIEFFAQSGSAQQVIEILKEKLGTLIV